MPETLLSVSVIKLFGRLMNEITLTVASVAGAGDNNFVQRQLAAADPKFARIYAFSFEGHFYELPKPMVFLVHGTGTPIDGTATKLDDSGVIARDWEFSFSGGAAADRDLFYWEYEKGDFSIRLDLETGPFEQILLA